ncbi:MAG: hydrolase [Myxococcota bacterium]|nr:hydrolase [Myxococcota bacterium]
MLSLEISSKYDYGVYSMNTTPPPFRPSLLLRNRHIQTCWSTIARKNLQIDLNYERVELKDRDFIDLAWTLPQKGPILLILHGLEGSTKSPYARGLLTAVSENGWLGALMHFRGCSDTPNRTMRAYHSGETEDLKEVLNHIKKQFPQRPLLACGFSLGGNVLLKYLGESGHNTLIDAAVAVSVPYSLGNCSDRIHEGFSRIYEHRLLSSLKRALLHKMARFNHSTYFGLTPKLIHKLRSIREFDDAVVAPMYGFLSANDYYNRCSSKQFLNGIRRPTLLIHASDDPFMPSNIIPHQSDLSEHIELAISPRGGHVGFIEGQPWNPKYWLEERIPRFLNEQLPKEILGAKQSSNKNKHPAQARPGSKSGCLDSNLNN